MSDLVESSDPNRLAMFDLNKHQDKVIDFKEWKVILASPPQLKLYKYWSRETRHDTVYMKTWEWAEVYSARYYTLFCVGSLNTYALYLAIWPLKSAV